jgi:hypothetical protein
MESFGLDIGTQFSLHPFFADIFVAFEMILDSSLNKLDGINHESFDD